MTAATSLHLWIADQVRNDVTVTPGRTCPSDADKKIAVPARGTAAQRYYLLGGLMINNINAII